MTYTIKPYDTSNISLKPSTTAEEIIRNISIIISTPKGSVPLDRELGVDMSFLDKPSTVAKTLFISAIKDAVDYAEPRAAVNKVTFDDNEPGKLIPIVEVEINE